MDDDAPNGNEPHGLTMVFKSILMRGTRFAPTYAYNYDHHKG